MMNLQSIKRTGFSLVELMIVIAIIGILAAIAVPAYGDYAVRAKVAEGLAAVSTFKVAAAEYHAVNGNFTSISNSAAGLGAATDYASDYVTSITLGTTSSTVATISVVMNSTALGLGTDVLGILFTGTSDASGIQWTCGATSGTTSGLEKYLPASCQ